MTALVAHPDKSGPGAKAADQLFDKLGSLRSTNSQWWAANSGRCYQLLLRWYGARYAASGTTDKRLLARLGTCYYQSAMFASWEDCENRRGLTSARQIEKQVRWDGVTDTDHDYIVVTDFLASHSAISAMNNNNTDDLPRREATKSK